KEHFFFYHEKQFSAGKAGAKLGIPRSAAYSWLKKDENDPSDKFQKQCECETRHSALSEMDPALWPKGRSRCVDGLGYDWRDEERLIMEHRMDDTKSAYQRRWMTVWNRSVA
ncbi:hypothetical protein CU097_002319, partial [Rhizopus azygosporus]